MMGVDSRVGHVEALPYEPNFFDAIFCSEVFEHLTAKQLELGLREITRVLKPGGCLYGTVPFAEHLDDQMAVCPHCGAVFHRWGHQQSFEVASLRKAIQQTLNVKKIFVTPLVDWSKLNWKGRSVGLLKKTLAVAGVHGINENIVFVCAKR
jgi:ubiquinone/menaquinone biosynthesis C-methylase UbiE